MIIQNAARASRIDDLSGQVNIANPCKKCQDDRYNKLMGILRAMASVPRREPRSWRW